ncbi:MAG: ABC transporter substrate-binding protein, partial [Terriglobales bacterium]
MNPTFNRYFGLMLLLVVATELALAQQPPIKIGELNVLSGSFAAYGKSGRQGAQLAIDEINASGGLLGRKLELIQVDDQAKPDVGVQEAK